MKRLEGSRFGSDPRHPAIFVTALTGAETSVDRRLPGTFRRMIGFIGPLSDQGSPSGTLDKTSHAVISRQPPV